jgi:hypothetical protein
MRWQRTPERGLASESTHTKKHIDEEEFKKNITTSGTNSLEENT